MHEVASLFRYRGVAKKVLFGFSTDDPTGQPRVLRADHGWDEISAKDRTRALKRARQGLLNGLMASGLLSYEQEKKMRRC